MNKDIYFYSNNDSLSKEVSLLINKYNLRDHFTFISYDKHGNNIPNFVKVLPTIYTVKKQIIQDEKIKEYILLTNKKNEILPFSISGDNSLSEQYSYIDSSGNYDENQTINMKDDSIQNFTLINQDHSMMIPDNNNNTTKQSKFDESLLDDYTSKRNRDDELIKKALNGSRTI